MERPGDGDVHRAHDGHRPRRPPSPRTAGDDRHRARRARPSTSRGTPRRGRATNAHRSSAPANAAHVAARCRSSLASPTSSAAPTSAGSALFSASAMSGSASSSRVPWRPRATRSRSTRPSRTTASLTSPPRLTLVGRVAALLRSMVSSQARSRVLLADARRPRSLHCGARWRARKLAHASARSFGRTSSVNWVRKRSWSCPGPWKTRWLRPASR